MAIPESKGVTKGKRLDTVWAVELDPPAALINAGAMVNINWVRSGPDEAGLLCSWGGGCLKVSQGLVKFSLSIFSFQFNNFINIYTLIGKNLCVTF